MAYQNAYYDAYWGYLQIADYFGDSDPWISYANKARELWFESSRPAHYGQGYIAFSSGYTYDFLTGERARGSFDPITLGNQNFGANPQGDYTLWLAHKTFHHSGYYIGDYAGGSTRTVREQAYAIQSFVNFERAGGARRPDMEQFIHWALDILHQWRTQNYYSFPEIAAEYEFMQPFMAGLMLTSLIDFVEWERAEGRDENAYFDSWDHESAWTSLPNAIEDFALWLYNDSEVVPGYTGASSFPDEFGGPDHQVGDRLRKPGQGWLYIDNAVPSEASAIGLYAAWDNLISPAYAWLYKETGETQFKTMFDEQFGSWIDGDGLQTPSQNRMGGKQFNQGIRNIFQGLRVYAGGDWFAP